MKLLSKEWVTPPMADDMSLEIRPLNALEFTEALAVFGREEADGLKKTLKAVSDWRGVEDADGKSLPFDQELVPELGIDICDWLFQQILEKSRLSKDAGKN